MLKIVDVHPSQSPQGEYVVLQNHGTLTVSLLGCALCSNSYFTHCPNEAGHEMYVFREDVRIKPYGRVVLFTGDGYDGWQPTTDGKSCYVAYWRRPEPVWYRVERVHLLKVESSRQVVHAQAYAPAATG